MDELKEQLRQIVKNSLSHISTIPAHIAEKELMHELPNFFDALTEQKIEWPEIGDKLIVQTNSGQTFYAIYSGDDEFDVHRPNGDEYRKQWYKYSSTTIVKWSKIL